MQQINPKCVDLAVRTAIALDSQVQLRSAFDRKHYFYSDLPVGYQITQHYGIGFIERSHFQSAHNLASVAPIALGGVLRLPEQDAVVRVKQIQLEQVLSIHSHQRVPLTLQTLGYCQIHSGSTT
jgi:aspartyl-tRNA(Asn)/glutamyl-tRNA(Gln) amidotransferase subunit B